MSLKNLYSFESFDLEGFLTGKTLLCTSCSEWKDYNTKELLGAKYSLVIISDTDEEHSNVGKTLTVKVPEKEVETISKPFYAKIQNGVAKVWGNNGYRNQLSIKAQGVLKNGN